MKNFVASILVGLVSVSVHATTRVPVTQASLGACASRALLIELNVDEATPKYQMVEAIKLLADYPNFSITPAHSELSAIAFSAKLRDNCVSDSCAKALGWFDLQKRLARFKGVAVSCELPSPKGGSDYPPPRSAPAMPGHSGDPNQPPVPGAGGVTGGNVGADISAD
jgi:hypothetical protein